MGEKEGGKVGAMGGGRRQRGGAVRCGPRSTDSSSSYAPDGQGRYTTTVYFRLPSLSLFPSLHLLLLRPCVRAKRGEGISVKINKERRPIRGYNKAFFLPPNWFAQPRNTSSPSKGAIRGKLRSDNRPGF